jgi:hypothetical protein
MTDRPNARELLDIARATLAEEVLPLIPADKRLSALMVASALGMAARELAASPPPSPRTSIADIRAGKHDGDVALYEALLAEARARAAISNPKYLESG